MAISINISNADEMTDREITAMLAFLRTLGGECEQVSEDEPVVVAVSVPAPVVLHHITEPEAPVLVAVDMTDDEVAASNIPPVPNVPDLASVFATPASVSTVERDAAGLPWDARIHSASKATIADGTWRMRRNVDEAEVNRVEAELRAVLNGAPAPAAPTAPAPAAPTAPAPAVPTAPTVAGAPVLDWKQFLNSMTKHIAEKRIDTKQIGEICRSLDLRHPGDLQIRPDQFPAFKVAAEAIIGMAI